MNKTDGKTPPIFTAALIFILLNAGIWLAFGIYTAVGAHPSYAGNNPLRWIFSAGTIFVGIGIIGLTLLLPKRSHLGFYVAVVTSFGFAMVIIFDQIGPVDIAVMIVGLIPAVLLLLSRRWYFSQPADSDY